MPDPVSKIPTGESDHARQKVITLAVQEAAETKDADGEIGLGHFILKRTVRPADLLCQERPEDKMHEESIDTAHAQYPERDPKQRGFPTNGRESIAAVPAKHRATVPKAASKRRNRPTKNAQLVSSAPSTH